jgi:hypothetical protein
MPARSTLARANNLHGAGGRHAAFASSCAPRSFAMDFGNPWSLLSNVLISLVGMTLFVRGKKEAQPSLLIGGMIMCVFPYFIDNLALMWTTFAGCIAGMWYLRRFD